MKKKLKFKNNCMRCEQIWKSKKQNPISCGKCKTKLWGHPIKEKKTKWILVKGKSQRLTESDYLKLKRKREKLEKKIRKMIRKKYKVSGEDFRLPLGKVFHCKKLITS